MKLGERHRCAVKDIYSSAKLVASPAAEFTVEICGGKRVKNKHRRSNLPNRFALNELMFPFIYLKYLLLSE